jgi:lipopolysaccharide export system ATP-binding protein
MKAFTADSIAMNFGSRSILKDVYLEAAIGQVVGILGRNGCGKSTLYKCLLGLFKSSNGTVRVDGVNVSKADAPRRFAYLPQNSYLPLDVPLRYSIALILGKAGNRGLFEGDPRASSLLERRPRSLSTGEVRYIECLVALSMDRPIILLDEPFSQIEPIYNEMLEERIRSAALGHVVFVSDHLYRNVQRVVSVMHVLREGTLRRVENDPNTLQRHGYLSGDAL